jgi:hypothetical protein
MNPSPTIRDALTCKTVEQSFSRFKESVERCHPLYLDVFFSEGVTAASVTLQLY